MSKEMKQVLFEACLINTEFLSQQIEQVLQLVLNLSQENTDGIKYSL